MRLLWTSNIVLPAVAEKLGLPITPFGGWLSTTTQNLAKQSDVELAIAMRAEVTDLSSVEHEGVRYYALPRRGLNRYDTSDSAADHVFSCFRPDLLHVEGTEMAYARRLLSRWSGPKVVSLQGVINGYRPYQFGRIESGEWVDCKSPGLLFTGLALWVNDRFRFRPRLAGERQTLAMASDILGRTLWDRAQASWLAPQANYHHCPRILREPFYQYKWTAERCEPFSIFVGNGASALKGAHFAVRALPLLQRHFPKVKLYIAGRDPFRLSRLSAQRAIGYSRYLTTLIRSQGVEAAVSFTGQLDAQAMADRMRKSHVVLLPSLIENSPNTLAEAMMMGVPVVAAYAGGVPSMARDEEEVLLYRADDPAMLALQVRRIFDDSTLSSRLSFNARERALKTHDPDTILDGLLSIYQRILKQV